MIIKFFYHKNPGRNNQLTQQKTFQAHSRINKVIKYILLTCHAYKRMSIKLIYREKEASSPASLPRFFLVQERNKLIVS